MTFQVVVPLGEEELSWVASQAKLVPTVLQGDFFYLRLQFHVASFFLQKRTLRLIVHLWINSADQKERISAVRVHV